MAGDRRDGNEPLRMPGPASCRAFDLCLHRHSRSVTEGAQVITRLENHVRRPGLQHLKDFCPARRSPVFDEETTRQRTHS